MEVNLKQYSNKEFARSGHDDKKYFINDFVNLENLKLILDEVFTSETMISEEAINFLENYYSFELLAALLYKQGWYMSEMDQEKILSFLKNMKDDAICY